MTNGGGDTELAKSNQFSSTLGLSPKNKLKEREIDFKEASSFR